MDFSKIEIIPFLFVNFLVEKNVDHIRNIRFENSDKIGMELERYLVDFKEKVIILDMEDILIQPTKRLVSGGEVTTSYLVFNSFINECKKRGNLIIFTNLEKKTFEVIKEQLQENYDYTCILNDGNIFFSGNEKYKEKIIHTFSKLNLSAEKFIDRVFYSSFYRDFVRQKILFLLEKTPNIIKRIPEKNHCFVLNSSSFHSNMYINIKPLLENYFNLYWIGYEIWRLLKKVIERPIDKIIAPNRNSILIASATSLFLKKNIGVIDHVTPTVALYRNKSTFDEIKQNDNCIITTDFLCTGTEIKISKALLWAKNANILGSISVLGLEHSGVSETEFKILCLSWLDKSYGYEIYSKSQCPYCN